MNINVPPQARDHFWEEPPPGSHEFWSFRFPPPCKVGERLVFRFDGIMVAEAVCCRIEAPGKSECESSGRFRRGYKVYWHPASFQDRRPINITNGVPSEDYVRRMREPKR